MSCKLFATLEFIEDLLDGLTSRVRFPRKGLRMEKLWSAHDALPIAGSFANIILTDY